MCPSQSLVDLSLQRIHLISLERIWRGWCEGHLVLIELILCSTCAEDSQLFSSSVGIWPQGSFHTTLGWTKND